MTIDELLTELQVRYPDVPRGVSVSFSPISIF